MSEENVQIIRRLVEAYNEGGFGAEATLDFFDEAAAFEEPPEQPGATTAEGIDAVAQTFGQFDEVWEEHRSDPEEIRVLDAERVLLLTVEHFRGREGLELSQPSGTVFTLRNGKIVRMQAFWERESAFKAAGLSE